MTLVEVIVAVLVLMIMFVMVFGIFNFFSRFLFVENQRVNIHENMRAIMMQLELDIRRSDQSIDVTASPCYHIGSENDVSVRKTYCFDAMNQTVERNERVVAQNVKMFSLDLLEEENQRHVLVNIIMKTNPQREEVKSNLKLLLR